MKVRVDADEYEASEYQIKELEYSLTHLKKYFEMHRDGKLNSQDARIFTYFAMCKLLELKGMAREVDIGYFGDSDSPTERV